jgi:hypothetical protein
MASRRLEELLMSAWPRHSYPYAIADESLKFLHTIDKQGIALNM